MARVTVEKCTKKVPNRFELVLLSAERARALASGAARTLPRSRDKNTIEALREIEEGTISLDELRQAVAQVSQTMHEVDEDDLLAMLSEEMGTLTFDELDTTVELAEFVGEGMSQPTEDEIFSILSESNFTEIGGDSEQPDDLFDMSDMDGSIDEDEAF